MIIRKQAQLRYSDVTPKDVYLNRRRFLGASAAAIAALAAPYSASAAPPNSTPSKRQPRLTSPTRRPHSPPSPATTTTTNSAPARTTRRKNAPSGTSRLAVDGDDRRRSRPSRRRSIWTAIMKIAPLEERIYRHRCVERWSIVVPWIGFSLSALLKQVEPNGESQVRRVPELLRSEADALAAARPASSFPTWKGCAWMRPCIRWRCWRSGCMARRCRIRTARRLRLVVPWKYGFKSIKSIVKISLVEKQPPTTWNHLQRARVRILFQRESGGRSSALEPGDRAAAGRASASVQDAHVQRLRRSGGRPVRRHGPAQELLMPT